MKKNILWLDNDAAWTVPYAEAMKRHGYEVRVVTSVGQAESFLMANRYDLLILDVMIPTISEDEERDYLPEDTDMGTKTGLVFYLRMKEKLKEANTAVFVTTVRLDRRIKEEFLRKGLPNEHFATKLALREIPAFLDQVKSILEEPKDQQSKKTT